MCVQSVATVLDLKVGASAFLEPARTRTYADRPAGREVWVVGVGSLIEEEPARSATNDGYGQSRQSVVALPPSSSLTPLRSLLQLLDNEALFLVRIHPITVNPLLCVGNGLRNLPLFFSFVVFR